MIRICLFYNDTLFYNSFRIYCIIKLMLDKAIAKLVSIGYVKWGLILCVTNGMGAFWYYRENRDRYDLEGFQTSATRYISY